MLTRRQLLHSLAATGVATQLPGAAFADFPPQSTIDNDPLRPRYHLMPQRGWMNDPCAPVYFNERYHMFFQYNPGASVWGDMHWAHAVSRDAVHWSERPVALAPTPGGPDSFGVFTGSMVVDKGVPTVLYTCVSPSSPELATLSYSTPPEREQQCLATPASLALADADAKLDTWNKLPRPVVPSPPDGMRVTGFRDPTPWREADGWYMLLASGEYRKGGDVLLYKSSDLRSWQFQHVFAEGKWTPSDVHDTVSTGETWECPDFFPLDGKHVLIHSTGTPAGRKTVWQIGTLDKRTMRWTADTDGELNHGPYYAPKTQLGAHGERILWGWIPEDRPEADFAKAGWAGCMSLPRVLSIQGGQLRFRPAPQIQALRGTQVANANDLPRPSLLQNEFVLRISNKPVADKPAPRGVANALAIVATGSGDLQWNGKEVALNEPLPPSFDVRCFVDHSVVEIFVGDHVVFTRRVYDRGGAAQLTLPAGYAIQDVQFFPLSA